MKTMLYYVGFLGGLYLFYLALATDFNAFGRLAVGLVGVGLMALFIRSVIRER